jgi:hypothetical protein
MANPRVCAGILCYDLTKEQQNGLSPLKEKESFQKERN